MGDIDVFALCAARDTDASSASSPVFAVDGGLSSPPRIAISGANPCVQKALYFERGITVGKVNRAGRMEVSVGGKGQCCVQAATLLSGPASATVVQFVGGSTGAFVQQHQDKQGIVHVDIDLPGRSTRICTTLLDESGGPETEIIEPSDSVAAGEVDAFLATCVEHAGKALALMGTAPPGCGDDFYERLVRAAHAKGTSPIILVDGYRAVSSALGTGLVSVLKFNLDEFRMLGTSLGLDAEMLAKPLAAQQQTTVLELLRRFHLKALAVTNGGHPAHLFVPDGNDHCRGWRFDLDGGCKMVNPIGSGDATAAGLLLALVRGLTLVTAFRLGLATGSAACETPSPACIASRQRVLELYDQISVHPM